MLRISPTFAADLIRRASPLRAEAAACYSTNQNPTKGKAFTSSKRGSHPDKSTTSVVTGVLEERVAAIEQKDKKDETLWEVFKGADDVKMRLSDEIEAGLKFRRSNSVGCIYGTSVIAGLLSPPVFTMLSAETDPAVVPFVVVSVGTAWLSAAFVNAKVTEPMSSNLGRISYLEGFVCGSLSTLGVHILLPIVLVALPTIVEYNVVESLPIVDALTSFPLDLWTYGGSTVWWGIVSFGTTTFPVGAGLGMALALPSTALIKKLGYNEGLWSGGVAFTELNKEASGK